jgi:hypothetical protein
MADDSRIPKMPVINPQKAHIHLRKLRKTILHGLSIPNPFRIRLFGLLVYKSGNLELRISIFQAPPSAPDE